MRFAWILALVVIQPVLASEQQVLDIGSRRELFVDQLLVDRLTGARLRLHSPQPAESAIRIDRPWEGPHNLGISLLYDQGVYRMVYRGTAGPEFTGRCYAESRDGIHWTKPDLGLIQVAGTWKNNAIASRWHPGDPWAATVTGRDDFWEGAGPAETRDHWTNTMTPFLDKRPGVPPEHRWKAVSTKSTDGSRTRNLFLHRSSDGFRWEKVQQEPVLVTRLPNAFDSLVSVFWSTAENQYVLFSRYMVDTQGRPARPGFRSIFRSASPDLIRWSEPAPMSYTGTGFTPSSQLYTNMAEPYFRAPHIYVFFPMRFMEGRQAVPDSEVRRGGLLQERNRDCSDGVFMTARAGSTRIDWIFREAFIRPGPGWENWGTRSNITLWGLHPTGEGEISLWVNRGYGTNRWEIRRYRLRTDGFVSVHAPYGGGELLTRPLLFRGKELEINYSTSAAGHVRVEIQDADGNAIPGYTREDCPEIVGDQIERVVSWKAGSDLSKLAGKPVRLRFVLKDADLYSLRFR